MAGSSGQPRTGNASPALACAHADAAYRWQYAPEKTDGP